MAFQYVLVKNSGRGRGYLPTIMPEASLLYADFLITRDIYPSDVLSIIPYMTFFQPEWEWFYTIYSAAKLVLLPGEGDKQTKLRLLEHHKTLEMGKT